MQIIKIGFSKPKTWKPFAAAIMFAYGIPYDHVYVRMHSTKYDRDLIYQASKNMVNFVGTKVFEEDNTIVDEYSVEISDENYLKLMQFAIDKAGYPYGVKQAIGMGIVRVFRLFGKNINNPFSDGEKTFVCSELASVIIKDFANLNENVGQDDITPKTIHDFLSKLNN